MVLFYYYIYDGTVLYKSSLDGNEYRVRNRPGKQKKANLLSLVKTKFDIIINSLKNDSAYNSDPEVQRLLNNYSKGISVKEIGNLENDAAYVINKQHMSFCLQEHKSSSLEDTNLLSYVGIHELAHVMSNSIDHSTEFIKNFKFLLNYSKGLTYKDPFTGKTEPVYIELDKLNTDDNYCGVLLTNSIK